MTAARPNNEAIFHAARDIHDPDRRREYVRQACGGDEARIALVEALLAAAGAPDSLLDRPAGGDPWATSDQPATASHGTVIGPYKLLEQIGEGGMGTVWMAQQTEPVKRLVAVKLIKAGMDSRQVIARFEAERQALALMDHANIARVLDGGTTKGESGGIGPGRPYFVMDLVKDVPITKYCDEHRLTPRQRLELFVPVCSAVQHAHQKGIIHRDLKPSNVLVALYDGRPVPKVIDFGVAKAAGQSLTDKTLVTGFGNIVGTLEYMSPEQAEINQLDIDTRSDIYSLGVLLYELLTGSPPFSRKELEQAGMLEMLRVIREQEPTKPSTKLSTAEGLPTLAANRGMEPAKLAKLVRGELDWIVMKALEKDRSRRYETANGFAQDVQRYLADEPVMACPPSVRYRFRKFVRRNKRTLLTVALLVAMLLVVAGSFGWMARDRAARRGRNAEAVTALLERCEDALRADQTDRAADALEAAERRAAEGGAEELAGRLVHCRTDLALLRELDHIDALRFTRRPDPKADAARRRVALTAYDMTPPEAGVATEAADRVNGSLVRDRVLTSLDLWLVADPSPTVRAVLHAADPDPYRNAMRDALAARNGDAVRALAAKPEALAQPARFAVVFGRLGWVTHERRRAVLESALRGRPRDLFLLMIMAQSYPDGGPWVAARVRWLQAAVAAHPEKAAAHNNLGAALHDLGDREGAIAEYQEAIRLDPTDPGPHLNLGVILVEKRNLDGAIAEYQKALRLDPKSVKTITSWGRVLARKKDLEGAIAKHWEAIKMNPNFAQARTNLGDALHAKGDIKGAILQYEKAVQIDPKDAASALTNWGVILWENKDVDAALAKYEEAIRVDPNYALAHSNRGVVLWHKGKKDAALVELREGVRLDPESAHAHGQLGAALRNKGDLAEALVHLRKAVRLDPEDPDYHNGLAAILTDKGQWDDAIAEFRKAVRLEPKDVTARHNLAIALRQVGKLNGALLLFQQLAADVEQRGFRHEDASAIVGNLIGCHERLEQFDQAVTRQRKWLAVVKEKKGADSLPYASALAALGRNLQALQKWTDAEAVLRESLALLVQKAPDRWMRFHVQSLVGGSLLGQMKYAEAEPMLLEGYLGMKQREKTMRRSKVRISEAALRLVQLHDATGKKDDAAKWRAIHEQQEGTRVGPVQVVSGGLKMHGKLDGKSATLIYEVKLTAGKTYVIEMVSTDSKALDPYLMLQGADRRHLAADDDSGGDRNARINYRVARDGVYRIHATSANAGRGDFTLRVHEKKEPARAGGDK
jgi:serine/threonine protein kinase/Flp pilus assembly protein TadD